MIKHEGEKYVLYSEDGSKKLGEFDTMEEAMAREEEVVKMEHIEESHAVDSLEGQAALVRDAYRMQHPAEMDGPWCEEVFDDHVIIARGQRYFRVPYTIAGAEVSFGESEEVKVEYVSVSEALEVIGEPSGKKWEIRVIREGVSKKNFIYTRHALESLLPFLKNAPVLAIELAPGIYGHARAGEGGTEIGHLDNPRGVEVDGLYEVRADLTVKEGWTEKLKGLVKKVIGGLSINAPVEGFKVKEALTWVKRFLGLDSVDLATVPSAGGAFLRATESEEGEIMNREKILELLKKKRPDLYAKLAADCTLEQAQEALEEAIGNRQQATLTAQEAQDLRALKEQIEKDSCDAYLTRRLTESNLPEPVRKKIEKQFSGSVFAREALDNFITAEKETLDALVKSGHVHGAGETRVDLALESVDKIQLALDRTFGVKVEGNPEIKPFRGLKQAYIQITRDTEVTGRLPERMMRAREAIVASDFPKLLDRTLNRRLVQDYREPNYHEDRLISSRGSATDFKTQESLRVGYYGDPPIVDPEVADYQEAAKPGEESITYKVQTRGNLLTVSRVAVINDDLDGIIKRIKGRGRAFRRGFARFVWNFFINNSTYDGDSTAWFTAGHGNLGSTALAAAEVWVAILGLMNMTEPNSAEKLGLGPDEMRRLSLAAPHALWDDAVKVNQAQYLDSNFTPNPVYKFFGADNDRVLAVPLLTDATDWGVLCDPSDRGLIEVKFLNGQQEPELFIADQPTVGEMFKGDKLQFKDRFEYGGDIEDFRGAYKEVVA